LPLIFEKTKNKGLPVWGLVEKGEKENCGKLKIGIFWFWFKTS